MEPRFELTSFRCLSQISEVLNLYGGALKKKNTGENEAGGT